MFTALKMDASRDEDLTSEYLMTHVHQLTFGPFAENTYIVSDDEWECTYIDPGMYDSLENARFFEYVNAQNLKPIQLVSPMLI